VDMKETSAMTEASGLVNGQGGVKHAPGAMPRDKREMGGKESLAEQGSVPRFRFSDQLRKMTMEAPLPSLAIAFLLGVLVARRR
jgi:hypothetical protein